jgi:hypothetical protein
MFDEINDAGRQEHGDRPGGEVSKDPHARRISSAA